MIESGRLAGEIRALRERLSRLSEASLRINQSLDLETVLQDVLDSACALTGARYGVIQLKDDGGSIVDFVTSGGTPEQARMFWQMPGAMAFQKHLEEFDGPVRLPDYHSHAKDAGLPAFGPPFPVGSVSPLLTVPIRHQDQDLAVISLIEKQNLARADDAPAGERPELGDAGDPAAGDIAVSDLVAPETVVPEFTVEDEETLVMFAAQAALAIHNAHTHRSEQRARARLATLVDMAPVGVLVFDAESGALVSANREIQRIVGELVSPGASVQDLLHTATYRDSDGQEIPRESLPLARAMSSGEPVRAEEIVIETSDGHSVSAIVNVMPIRTEADVVESLVETVQDMTPVEDLERLRAEFLGVVGHELRAPLAGIKGSVTTLLESASPLDPGEIVQYHRIINDRADDMRDLISDLIDIVRIETATLEVSPEPADVHRLLDSAKGTFVSAGGRDNIRVNLAPDLPPVTADTKRIVQVITNLLTNAERNSHEASAIHIDATHEGVHVAISVADSGRGVPPERLPHMFKKSLRAEGTERSPDLGLSICKGIVEAHGGRIWAESDGLGLGSRLTFTVPTSEQTYSSPSAEPAGRSQHDLRHPDEIRPTVLAIDDDPRTLKLVRDALDNAGCVPTVTGDPTHATDLVREAQPDVVVLDLMLPGIDGFDLLRDILAAGNPAVIILSAYDQQDLITRAFGMGALDYIVKPFSPTELAARVKAALRKRAGSADYYMVGDLTIDYGQRLVTVAGETVDLTPIEYRLLAELTTRAGSALTHDQLLQRVWGAPRSGDAGPMRTTIKNLRRKLGDQARSPKYIITVPHIGYRMVQGTHADPSAR